MHRLYLAADRIEAQRLLDLLRYQRIPAVILGDYLSGAVGELPATLFPSVWLLEDGDRHPAERVLAAFLAPPEVSDDPWTCPACGEAVEGCFEVCWNCGTGRTRE